MTYEQWMKAVDDIVSGRCGVSMDFLPDWLSRDAYDDGCTPTEGAEACLAEAGLLEYF